MVAGGMQTLEPERAIWVHAWNKRVVARMAAETDYAIGICQDRDTGGWQAFHRWSGWVFASRMTEEAAEALVVRVSPLNWDFEAQAEVSPETMAGLKDAIREMAQ